MYYLLPGPAPQAVAAIAEAAAIAASSSESPMKNHFKWKLQQTAVGSPLMASLTLPTVTADDDIYLDPRLTMSPNLPGSAAGFMLPGLMSPAAPAYGFPACSPSVLLERLGPHILRSHVSTAQHKAIPHNDDIDLEAFRRKDPREWNMDDVIGWMISVAKRRGIPVEDMNMHRFANCTGPLMTLMNQQNFIDRDNNYGALLYSEFRKLMGDEYSNFLDEWMRLHKDDVAAGPSHIPSLASTTSAGIQSALSMVAEAAAVASLFGRGASSTIGQPCTSGQCEINDVFGRPGSYNHRESVIKATGTADAGSISASSMGPLSDLRAFEKVDSKVEAHFNQLKGMRFNLDERNQTARAITASATSIPKLFNGKIKKRSSDGPCTLTLSGKPRKRSQHTRGNKLWEFIRSSLRDPKTCPSIVKWENEAEGIFRIVESEKLARLWGEKKNNKKMTYEKLSRAMRTYYEKQILVPVPKTGLYPKKLVYKFGRSVWPPDPNAKGCQLNFIRDSPPPASKSSGRSEAEARMKKFSNPLAGFTSSSASNVLTSPFHASGISPLAVVEDGKGASSGLLTKTNAEAAIAAANGLMSLADAASRQVTTSFCKDADHQTDAESIDIDGQSETRDVPGAIGEAFVNGDGAEDDVFSMVDDDIESECDTPPPLLE